MIGWFERFGFREVTHKPRIQVKLISLGDWVWWNKEWHHVQRNLGDAAILTAAGRSFDLDGKIVEDGEFRHLTPYSFKMQLVWLLLNVITAGIISAVVARFFSCR